MRSATYVTLFKIVQSEHRPILFRFSIRNRNHRYWEITILRSDLYFFLYSWDLLKFLSSILNFYKREITLEILSVPIHVPFVTRPMYLGLVTISSKSRGEKKKEHRNNVDLAQKSQDKDQANTTIYRRYAYAYRRWPSAKSIQINIQMVNEKIVSRCYIDHIPMPLYLYTYICIYATYVELNMG